MVARRAHNARSYIENRITKPKIRPVNRAFTGFLFSIEFYKITHFPSYPPPDIEKLMIFHQIEIIIENISYGGSMHMETNQKPRIKLNLEWVSNLVGEEYKQWRDGDVIIIESQTGTGKTHFMQNILWPDPIE